MVLGGLPQSCAVCAPMWEGLVVEHPAVANVAGTNAPGRTVCDERPSCNEALGSRAGSDGALQVGQKGGSEVVIGSVATRVGCCCAAVGQVGQCRGAGGRQALEFVGRDGRQRRWKRSFVGVGRGGEDSWLRGWAGGKR